MVPHVVVPTTNLFSFIFLFLTYFAYYIKSLNRYVILLNRNVISFIRNIILFFSKYISSFCNDIFFYMAIVQAMRASKAGRILTDRMCWILAISAFWSTLSLNVHLILRWYILFCVFLSLIHVTYDHIQYGNHTIEVNFSSSHLFLQLIL